jgi:hypothetical protein
LEANPDKVPLRSYASSDGDKTGALEIYRNAS